jgi:hypothetical protein
MDAGNVYMLRNKLESDVGEAVDVTDMNAELEDVGVALRQFARKLTIRINMNTVLNFILFIL